MILAWMRTSAQRENDADAGYHHTGQVKVYGDTTHMVR